MLLRLTPAVIDDSRKIHLTPKGNAPVNWVQEVGVPEAGRLLLIDAQNGKTLGNYVISDKIVGNLSCYTRQNGFSVYTVQDDMSAIRYVPIGP